MHVSIHINVFYLTVRYHHAPCFLIHPYSLDTNLRLAVHVVCISLLAIFETSVGVGRWTWLSSFQKSWKCTLHWTTRLSNKKVFLGGHVAKNRVITHHAIPTLCSDQKSRDSIFEVAAIPNWIPLSSYPPKTLLQVHQRNVVPVPWIPHNAL